MVCEVSGFGAKLSGLFHKTLLKWLDYQEKRLEFDKKWLDYQQKWLDYKKSDCVY